MGIMIVGAIIVLHFDVAVQSINWATTSKSSHSNAMSLKVRQLVKKISAVFKDKPTTLPTPEITLAWYEAMELPPLSFLPIFKLPKHLPQSIEIENLGHQIACIDHFVAMIDRIYEDDLPMSWNYKRSNEHQGSLSEHLAQQLRIPPQLCLPSNSYNCLTPLESDD
jgi:hypothetical protein